MARIKRDDSSWKARGILRRDARHDLENLSDEASNGKIRRSKRKARKGCEHKYPAPPPDSRWGEVRCVHCGKGKFYFKPQAGYGYGGKFPRYGRREDPTKVNREAVSKETFFPVHPEGTCATCDERRRILAQAR